MNEDEAYLRRLNVPEDAWLFSGQQWYTAAEAAEHMGVSTDIIRAAAERGTIPGAVLHDVKRVGWRFPRSGLLHYLAGQRRKTAERQSKDAG